MRLAVLGWQRERRMERGRERHLHRYVDFLSVRCSILLLYILALSMLPSRVQCISDTDTDMDIDVDVKSLPDLGAGVGAGLGTPASSSSPADSDSLSVLVVCDSFSLGYSPGNLRIRDISIELASDGHMVHLLSLRRSISSSLQRQVEAHHVSVIPYSDNRLQRKAVAVGEREGEESLSESSVELSMNGILEGIFRHVDVAFITLWMWYPDNAVELVAPVLRRLNPAVRIVLLTDDAHLAWYQMLGREMHRSYPLLLDIFPHFKNHDYEDVLSQREHYAFQLADWVMPLTERDEGLMRDTLDRAGVNHSVLHWGTQLVAVNESWASRARSMPWEDRDGLVFVGFGDSPTNRLALHWFFQQCYPLLASYDSMQRVPIYIVGSPPANRYQDIRELAADVGAVTHVEFVGSMSDDTALYDFLSHRRLMIAPILASTGINTKVILGLASHIPIVATEAAVIGFDAVSPAALDSAMLIADNPYIFTEKIYTAYHNKTLWRQKQADGFRLAEQTQMQGKQQLREDLINVLRHIR
jgi:hypothetical protein